MRFQILDADYTYDDIGRPVIRLYGRDSAGQSVCCFVPGFEPYFYLKPGSPEKAGELAKVIGEKFREFVTDVQEVRRFEPLGYFRSPAAMLRIVLNDPKGVPAIRDDVRALSDVAGMYETDILFRNRYLIDSGLGGMSWVETDSQPLEGDKYNGINLSEVTCDIRTVSRTVTPLDVITSAPLRYMAFDIECLPIDGSMPQPDSSPIIMISCTFEPYFNGSRTRILVGKQTKWHEGDIETFPDEVRMLERFFQTIKEYDPDVLAGYNSGSFDIPYIVDRLKHLEDVKKVKIRSAMGRDGKSVYYRRFGNMTSVSIAGRVAVDVLPIIRREFSLKQYTLKNTAHELLNMEKLDVSPFEMEEYWKDSGDKLKLFVDYARRDSELAMDLLQRLSLLDKFMALSRVSGTLIQDILEGGQTNMVENILMQEYRKRNRVMPSKPDSDLSHQRGIESEELKGGEVLEPEKGLIEDVVVMDYKSLYPTIMMAHNLCYTTEIIKDEPEEGVLTTPSGGKFVSSDVQAGIVPAILKFLLDRRVDIKKKMKSAHEDEIRVLNATQLALKILLNSFYGYSGYTRARLFSLELANSVTSFGRNNILNTKHLIEAEIKNIYLHDNRAYVEQELPDTGRDIFSSIGLKVVYGDTDSVFVKLSPEGLTLEEGGAVGRKISEIVSSKLPDPMELEFESFARRSIFLAKKRYAVWVFEPGGRGWVDSIKVKGMETIRRDWCELTSKTLNRVLELVLREGNVDEAIKYVRQVVNSVRNIDLKADPSAIEDLILTRKFTKRTESYQNKQPHVMVVEKMKKRSGFVPSVGDRIPFVITAEGGLFATRAEDPEFVIEHNISLDVDYYIKKQILPPVERIFRELGVEVAFLDYDEKQKGLMDFGGGMEIKQSSDIIKKTHVPVKKNQTRLGDF